MPQDELWRASARLTGWQATCLFDPLFDGKDNVIFRPTWSKMPARSETYSTVLTVPTYARDFIPGLIRVGHFELDGGLAKQAPAVLRHELKHVLQQFQEGALH